MMPGYDCLKSHVLSCWRKVESDCDVVISSGSASRSIAFTASLQARAKSEEKKNKVKTRTTVQTQAKSGMDTGRVDPRIGSGRVEIFYVNFAVSVVFLIKVVMKKCYVSTLAKISKSF